MICISVHIEDGESLAPSAVAFDSFRQGRFRIGAGSSAPSRPSSRKAATFRALLTLSFGIRRACFPPRQLVREGITTRTRGTEGRGARGQRGFTLIELLAVVGIIGVLATIALALYANVTASSRVAKAQADVRTLATAVGAYSAHMGALPPSLDTLTAAAVNTTGIVAGPFMVIVPAPPSTAWSYAYAPAPGGSFVVSGSGEGATVSAQ